MEISLSISIHATSNGEPSDSGNVCEDERMICVVGKEKILLSGVLDGLMKMPVLHVVNVAVGGVLGFAGGFVLCWVIALTLSFLFPLLDACFSTEITAFFTASPVYDFFLHTNPFNILL